MGQTCKLVIGQRNDFVGLVDQRVVMCGVHLITGIVQTNESEKKKIKIAKHSLERNFFSPKYSTGTLIYLKNFEGSIFPNHLKLLLGWC